MVREFSREGSGDYEMISKWYGDWEKECPSLDCLPEVGFIVDECVAGFLYSTDSRVCIMDCFITDPNVTAEERNTALDTLVVALEDEARLLDNKIVIANSVNKSVQGRAMKHGFNYLGESASFCKEIK